MAERKKTSDGADKGGRYKLTLTGLKPNDERPNLIITATDRDLKAIHVSEVNKEGTFDLPPNILKSAHRILIGPKSDQPDAVPSEDILRYRASDFVELLKAGSINISQTVWNKWFLFIRCVSGRVRLCHRRPWWYYDLFKLATRPTLDLPRLTSSNASVSLRDQSAALQPNAAASISELLYYPYRCRVICNGTVEVYRRTCCCRPWIFDDIRFPDLVRDLEDIVRGIPEIIPIPRDPNPPDPPYAVERAFFKDGSLDELAVNARFDLDAIRQLPKAGLVEFVNARPYLLCRRSCGAPQKVGQGTIGPDGRFNICWLDRPRPSIGFCRDEYAYIVKQRFGFFNITIYNGVAANIWFNYGDEPTLTSYSPFAFACRDNGPGDGAYVFLDLIGDTESWNLKTPNATGWDRVAAPAYNDGLAFPSATPAAAVGALLNRNWGGTLKLNYKFSEDMRLIGAKYYRISITEADAGGNPVGPSPTGTRYYLSDGLSWEKSVPDGLGGADIVPVALGPFTVGTEDNLFLIPYDGGPAPNGGDWNAGQYHGFLNTNDARWNDPDKRHLLTLEVFDGTGKRLRPTGTPATGLPGSEGTAAFTYRRRFQDLGPTANVPFGALTHMFWWDNQGLVATIENLNKDGILFNEECLFLQGTASSTFGIGYRAYHPNEMFQYRHGISWQRGVPPVPLNVPDDSKGTLLASSSVNVGEPPASPGNSPINTFAQMLRTDLVATRKKCAFTVFLGISAKTFDGEVTVTPNVQVTAAFAIEIN